MYDWFKTFDSFNRNSKSNTFNYSLLVSQNESISDGINHLPICSLYRNMVNEEMKYSNIINGYTDTGGHPALIGAISILENIQENIDKVERNVCVTAGATAAIEFVFEFFTGKYKCQTCCFLGLSYYYFEKCAQHFEMEYQTLISTEKGRILPSLEEIRKKVNSDLIFLTLPANPSGEIYNQNELEMLLNYVKMRDAILVIDKCQDEDISFNKEFDINLAIKNSEAQKNCVIINSFSKVRSIAGARIGYIIGNDKELIEYCRFKNEMTYFNHSLGYEFSIIMDCLYRVLFLKDKSEHKYYIRLYRNLILLTLGVNIYQTVFSSKLKLENLYKDYKLFTKELFENQKIIERNYRMCKEKLKGKVNHFTKLGGGYNFCIEVEKGNKDESYFVEELSRKCKSYILSQKNFGLESSDGKVWIRLSLAMEPQKFETYIELLGRAL